MALTISGYPFRKFQARATERWIRTDRDLLEGQREKLIGRECQFVEGYNRMRKHYRRRVLDKDRARERGVRKADEDLDFIYPNSVGFLGYTKYYY